MFEPLKFDCKCKISSTKLHKCTYMYNIWGNVCLFSDDRSKAADKRGYFFSYIFFLFLPKTIVVGSASNENPQHMFTGRNKKIYQHFFFEKKKKKKRLNWSYASTITFVPLVDWVEGVRHCQLSWKSTRTDTPHCSIRSQNHSRDSTTCLN